MISRALRTGPQSRTSLRDRSERLDLPSCVCRQSVLASRLAFKRLGFQESVCLINFGDSRCDCPTATDVCAEISASRANPGYTPSETAFLIFGPSGFDV